MAKVKSRTLGVQRKQAVSGWKNWQSLLQQVGLSWEVVVTKEENFK
jgi:3-methyladenine DNA glycosylase Tag